jgi:hypothetical protein
MSIGRLDDAPDVVVRVCRHRIRIRVKVGGRERVVTVDPENVVISGEVGRS